MIDEAYKKWFNKVGMSPEDAEIAYRLARQYASFGNSIRNTGVKAFDEKLPPMPDNVSGNAEIGRAHV